MNRLGINLWNWTKELDMSCVELIGRAAGLGFTAVELPMTSASVPDMDMFKDALRRHNMEVSLCASLTAGRDISSFDPDIRRSTREYMLECLDTAHQLGAKVFAGPLYAGGGKRHRLSDSDREMEWSLAVEGLRGISDRARELGVELAIEPIQRYRTSVVNTVRQALRMIGDIGRDNVGVHFDTFHANIEEESVTGSLEEVLKAGKLAHFHACANNRGAPGTGHLPWENIFALLKRYGYGGHVTMETFCEGALDPGWYPLAPTQDALAKTGLDYMKKILS